MTNPNRLLLTAATVLMLGSAGAPMTAVASGAGAFIGGMVTSRVLTNMSDRTQADQQQAYYAQQSAQRPVAVQQAQAAPAQLTTQQRLSQLDELAANGYITPAEYKQKKQSIINGM